MNVPLNKVLQLANGGVGYNCLLILHLILQLGLLTQHACVPARATCNLKLKKTKNIVFLQETWVAERSTVILICYIAILWLFYLAVARVPVPATTFLKFAVPVVFKIRISKVYG